MNSCSGCAENAKWKCTLCDVLLCVSHKLIHIDDEKDHHITRYKFAVAEPLKSKVMEAILSKLKITTESYQEVITSSDIIITQTLQLTKTACEKIIEIKRKLLSMMRLLNESIIEEQIPEIEGMLKTVIVYEKLESLDQFQSWAAKEILVEKQKNLFPWINEDVKGIIIKSHNNQTEVEMNPFDSDSWTYKGEIENQVPNGRGSLSILNSYHFEGNFINGNKEGQGIYTLPDSSVYTGEFKNNLFEAKGTYKYKDGSVYSGDWKASKREGLGVLIYHDGKKYDGEFKNDVKEGRGVYAFTDGSVYIGEFKNDLKEGKGINKYIDRSVYDGEWKAGKKEGRGIYTFVNGDIYNGQWKAGKKEGSATYKYADGAFYDGEFKNDLKNGYGKYTYADTAEYIGMWKAGKREGTGRLLESYGALYEGEFKNNLKEGNGFMRCIDGSTYRCPQVRSRGGPPWIVLGNIGDNGNLGKGMEEGYLKVLMVQYMMESSKMI